MLVFECHVSVWWLFVQLWVGKSAARAEGSKASSWLTECVCVCPSGCGEEAVCRQDCLCQGAVCAHKRVTFWCDVKCAHYLCRVCLCLGGVCIEFNWMCVSVVREVSVGCVRCVVGG